MPPVFKRHSRAEQRKRSAVALVKRLLPQPSDDILPEHRREALGMALFKLTEAESGKYATRYRSKEALTADKTLLRHDHVLQRGEMIKRLLTARPEDVDDILDAAVGCTITKDEHARLAQYSNE